MTNERSAMVNLTKNFMRVVPSEKKKVQLIPEAIVCHIDESTLFESTVSERLLLPASKQKVFNCDM